MATIDDFGGTTDPLNAPPLGGPTGWAAAVRDYLKGMVVQKAGDTMAGTLNIERTSGSAMLIAKNTEGSAELWTDRTGAGTSGLRIHADGKARWLISDDGTRLVIARYDISTGAWVETAFMIDGATGEVRVPSAPVTSHGAANKAYVDAIGVWQAWTPVVKKGATTMPVTNYSSRYCRIGNTVFVELSTVFTTANSTGDALTVVPPVPITSGKGGGFACGVGTIVTPYVPVHFYRQAAAGTDFIVQNHTTGANYGTAIDANDSLRGSWSYEV